MKNQRRRKLP